jgi:regulatory protein
VRLHLTRGEPLDVALEALERLRLGVGDPLPPRRRHHLLNADADVRVRDAALALLSHRARTRLELRRKLTAKGFRAARVDHCLDHLEARGLLDDAAVAAAFVRDRLRHRPRGKARLTSELGAKGVKAETASQVIDTVLEDEGLHERDLAQRVGRAWATRQRPDVAVALAHSGPSPEREKVRRRLYGYLARRGFRGQALSAGMEAAVDAAATSAGEPPSAP